MKPVNGYQCKIYSLSPRGDQQVFPSCSFTKIIKQSVLSIYMAISKLEIGGVKPFSLQTNYMLDLPLCEHTHHEWKLQQKADLTKKHTSKETTYIFPPSLGCLEMK